MKTPPSPGPRPLWVPPGVNFESLPTPLQYALTEIISPAYEELVLRAPNAFERSAAMTYVHLAWLELIEQVSLGKDLETQLPTAAGTKGHEERIAQFLRIVGAKDRTAKFLLELQKSFEKLGDEDLLRRVPR